MINICCLPSRMAYFTARSRGVAWVWNADNYCYQKYDTGEYAITQSFVGHTSIAGILVATTTTTVSGTSTTTTSKIADATCGAVANSGIDWTGQEDVLGQLGTDDGATWGMNIPHLAWEGSTS